MSNTAQSSRRAILRALAASGALALPRFAGAQIGDKPVRFILPVATASGVDTITRAAGPALSKALGHPIVIENQPGAGGIVGTSALVKSAPDGFTLSIVSNNHVIYPSVYKSVPFDPVNDLIPAELDRGRLRRRCTGRRSGILPQLDGLIARRGGRLLGVLGPRRFGG